jgi:hypothetical protein
VEISEVESQMLQEITLETGTSKQLSSAEIAAEIEDKELRGMLRMLSPQDGEGLPALADADAMDLDEHQR